MADTNTYTSKQKVEKWTSRDKFKALDLTDIPIGTEYNLTGNIELEDLDASIQNSLNTVNNKSGGTISGNVTITGDLTVNGTEHINNVENLDVENQMIYTNSKGTTFVGNGGIGIKTNTTDVYGIVYDTASDSVKLGLGTADSDGKFTFNTGEGEPVAIRSDSSELTDSDLISWDATGNKLVDSGIKKENVVVKDNLKDYYILNGGTYNIEAGTGVDFNTLTTPGVYDIGPGGERTNAPSDLGSQPAKLVVESYYSSDEIIFQKLISYASETYNCQYHRQRMDRTTWGEWHQVATTNYVDNKINKVFSVTLYEAGD